MGLPFFQSATIELLDQKHVPDLQRIKSHFRRLQQPAHHDAALSALDRLGNAYRFRHFSRFCGDTEQAVLDDFYCPDSRHAMIGKLPITFMDWLYGYERLVENRLQWHELDISKALQQAAVTLANRYSSFSGKRMFSSFTELCRELDIHQRMALICTCELQQHCLDKKADDHQEQLFYSGVESAGIAMMMARKQQHSPLHMYLCSLLHHIALMYIHRLLTEADSLPHENQLLDEIQQLDHRLAYWIARDWGFPDRMLEHMKERFNHQSETSNVGSLLDKSEHACLVLTLSYRELLSKRQARSLLQLMELPELAESVNNHLLVH